LKFSDNIKKRKEFDKKIINLIYKKRNKILKILKENNIKNVNINLFPETLLSFYKNKEDALINLRKIVNLYKKNKKNIIIELLEN